MKILVIDVGGTNVKMLVSGESVPRKFASGPELTPKKLVEGIAATTADWPFDVVSIGFPGPIKQGRILKEPVNLGGGWLHTDLATLFGKPTKVINDAALQAIGSYQGDRMLFLGLGTGLGSTLISDGAVIPMELGHLPYKKKKTFEDFVGQRGYDWLGKHEWIEAVHDVVSRLKTCLVADYVVLGGGNSKKLPELPPDCRLGDNVNAFIGGRRLWEEADAWKGI